jgi:hypothetical protein
MVNGINFDIDIYYIPVKTYWIRYNKETDNG